MTKNIVIPHIIPWKTNAAFLVKSIFAEFIKNFRSIKITGSLYTFKITY